MYVTAPSSKPSEYLLNFSWNFSYPDFHYGYLKTGLLTPSPVKHLENYIAEIDLAAL